jgi:hypothetical protein
MTSYVVVIERASDGGYGAWCPDLPGCVALADTEDAVLAEMRQMGAWLARWRRDRCRRAALLARTSRRLGTTRPLRFRRWPRSRAPGTVHIVLDVHERVTHRSGFAPRNCPPMPQ